MVNTMDTIRMRVRRSLVQWSRGERERHAISKFRKIETVKITAEDSSGCYITADCEKRKKGS